MDVVVKIIFYPASLLLLYCSQVRVNTQPWCDLPHRVDTHRNCTLGTASCIPAGASCQKCKARPESALGEPWTGKPTPNVQNSRSKTRAQLLLGFRPHLPKPAHFTRQYFSYWSERHSLKSVTTKKMCILYIPKPLHVPMDSSFNASTSTNISGYNTHQLQHKLLWSPAPQPALLPLQFPWIPQL